MSAKDELPTRPVALPDVPPAGRVVEIVATPDERALVAQAIGVVDLAALRAGLRVSHFRKDGLEVTGEIRAHVTETCVVTGETFDSDVVAPVDIRFSPDGRDPNAPLDPDELVDLDAPDPPDLLIGGRIDLWAVVVEFLALALDPYPRKPGASFKGAGDEAPQSAFAALSSLRKSE